MQGHVYHWRHGWIPLTHYAALVKAHGSHKGAAKYLNESNGHHGSESHKLGEAAHGHQAPAFKAVSAEHNLSALEVRKADKGSGFNVVHKPSGMRITEHSTKASAEAARQDYATSPHDLNVSGESLRGNKAAMEHLQGVAQTHQRAEIDRKREASMVVAAKRQMPAGPKVSNPAKPGDLVVVSKTQHSYSIGEGRQATEEHTPGVVTHVHSDGRPIAYRDARGAFHTVSLGDETRVMPQGQIDVHGFLGRVRDTNRYHASSDQVKPYYDSLHALTEVAKKYRRNRAA